MTGCLITKTKRSLSRRLAAKTLLPALVATGLLFMAACPALAGPRAVTVGQTGTLTLPDGWQVENSQQTAKESDDFLQRAGLVTSPLTTLLQVSKINPDTGRRLELVLKQEAAAPLNNDNLLEFTPEELQQLGMANDMYMTGALQAAKAPVEVQGTVFRSVGGYNLLIASMVETRGQAKFCREVLYYTLPDKTFTLLITYPVEEADYLLPDLVAILNSFTPDINYHPGPPAIPRQKGESMESYAARLYAAVPVKMPITTTE